MTGAVDAVRVAPHVRQVVLKLHSRCNLRCRHCYLYESVDQSWRDRPAVMTRDTVARVAARIGEHAERHGLPWVRVILHGGEPLLAGVDLIDHAATAIRAALPPHTDLRLRMQTNGVLLDNAALRVLGRHGVRVAVSLDGGRVANDRYRRYADGRGSFDQAARGLRRLRDGEFTHLYAGILCTVDLRNDPVEVYDDLCAFAPPTIDLLLPLGNWTNRPPGRAEGTAETPYGDWLVAVFDRWYRSPRPEPRVRLFHSLIALSLGKRSDTEAVGLNPPDVVTVETDGGFEHSDALRTTAAGMSATGLDVTRHSLDDVLRSPEVRARLDPLAALGPACRSCSLVRVCGGGLHAHRYDAATGFANPSVYCPDLIRLIRHVQGRLVDDLRRLGRHQGRRARAAVPADR